MDIPPLTSDDLACLAEPKQNYQKVELLCRLAIYSYLEHAELAGIMVKAPWDGFKDWDLGENQGFVCWSPDCAVVSFRGTDSKRDWSQNAKVLWPSRHELGGRIHRGFAEVSEQAKARVLEILSSLDGGPRHLWITGHSLGGAIATELSAELMTNTLDPFSKWAVTTFGAPRLGDLRFEHQYESRIGKGHCESHWWFVNDGDPVPHLPPNLLGYVHSGLLFWFSKSGKLIPVDEREVGLQKAIEGEKAEAARRWNVLEQSIPDFQNEEEYTQFLNTLATKVGEPIDGITLDPETGRLQVQADRGELQGALGGWIAKDHKLSLYLSRIRRLSQDGIVT